MKLLHQFASHTHIGTPWEKKVNSWHISVESTDFGQEIRDRFGLLIVQQQVKPIIEASFKGARTNWFYGNEKKDKQKVFIIEEVIKFIQNNTNALVAQWSEQSAHN